MSNAKRLSELDGLRAIAALVVIVYHYLARWDEVLPYGSALGGVARFGALGVNLFFIISGFVIFMSLERCGSGLVFARRRAARLLPAMLVCSVMTFVAMRLIDTPFTEMRREHWTGFLPSWTFTPPQVWRIFVPIGGWIDGVYWTLYVEMKFYVLAAAFYFFQGQKFFRAGFLALLLLGAVVDHIPTTRPLVGLAIEHALFPAYLPFFCAGMALYDIYERRAGWLSLTMLGFSMALAIAAVPDPQSAAIVATFFAIFFVIIFARRWVAWLSSPVLVTIGVASYPLYLIHQNIGIGMMSLIEPEFMQSWFYAVALMVIAGMILTATTIHHWVERPVEKYFKSRRKTSSQPAAREMPIAGG